MKFITRKLVSLLLLFIVLGDSALILSRKVGYSSRRNRTVRRAIDPISRKEIKNEWAALFL